MKRIKVKYVSACVKGTSMPQDPRVTYGKWLVYLYLGSCYFLKRFFQKGWKFDVETFNTQILLNVKKNPQDEYSYNLKLVFKELFLNSNKN